VCFALLLYVDKSRDSSVGMVTGYRPDGRGVRVWVPVGVRFFSSHVTQTGSGAHRASYPTGTGGLFPLRVKLQGREPDHSPTTSAEVKKMWIYTSTPPYVFMAY
jgi:hypothetical protein